MWQNVRVLDLNCAVSNLAHTTTIVFTRPALLSYGKPSVHMEHNWSKMHFYFKKVDPIQHQVRSNSKTDVKVKLDEWGGTNAQSRKHTQPSMGLPEEYGRSPVGVRRTMLVANVPGHQRHTLS